jgi:hypothetical protein
VDSESVKELAEEGQPLEAAAIAGVEEASDPDVAEVRTKEVPADDVPTEYDHQDQVQAVTGLRRVPRGFRSPTDWNTLTGKDPG